MTKLHISKSLSLPIDAVTQKFGILGRTGSGKSYFATKLCEEMLDAKAQVVAIDPVGVWWGLRVLQNGSPGYNIPILGGLHADIPLEPAAGALIADLIVDKTISAVVDVSNFLLSEQRKFATDFATQLFHRKKSQRSALHLFVEEAQEFVPQQVRGDVAKMVGAFERLLKLGRNFGIGATLISQRPQSVNKDVLNQTECLFAFQMTGPQERKAIESWVAEKGLEKDIVGELPKLKTGEAHVWSPQWLQISETVKISEKKTADVSATPKPGVKSIEPKQLSQIELADLSDKMLATIERAKKEDPKELQKKVAELQRTIAMQQKIIDDKHGKTETKIVEKPVLKDSQITRFEKIAERMHAEAERHGKAMSLLWGNFNEIATTLKDAMLALRTPAPEQPIFNKTRGSTRTVATPPVRQQRMTGLNGKSAAGTTSAAEDGELWIISATQQRILDALAWLESIGNDQPTTIQVGAIALIDATGGHFSNTVGPLSSHGFVERGAGRISLTEKGRQFARIPESVSTLADYHDVLRQRLRRAKSANGKTVGILNVIIDRGGAEVTAEEIGQEVGIDHTGGHFSNTIGPLGTLGLIKRSHGVIRPTEIIFPPGLSISKSR